MATVKTCTRETHPHRMKSSKYPLHQRQTPSPPSLTATPVTTTPTACAYKRHQSTQTDQGGRPRKYRAASPIRFPTGDGQESLGLCFGSVPVIQSDGVPIFHLAPHPFTRSQSPPTQLLPSHSTTTVVVPFNNEDPSLTSSTSSASNSSSSSLSQGTRVSAGMEWKKGRSQDAFTMGALHHQLNQIGLTLLTEELQQRDDNNHNKEEEENNNNNSNEHEEQDEENEQDEEEDGAWIVEESLPRRFTTWVDHPQPVTQKR